MGQELARAGDEVTALSIGLKSVVSDTDKAARQHMEEETVDEITRLESHDASGVSSAPIAISKRDPALLEGDETFVANGDAMRVAAEIAQDLLRAGHGRLAVDDPLPGRCLTQELVAQRGAQARRVCLERPIEAVEELASEDPGEDAHRHEEPWPGRDPAVPRLGEAAARHDAMDVRVKGERLRPRVEDGDGAGHATQAAPADVV